MNIKFYAAYEREIEPLLYGVLWTEEQRIKATKQIMSAVKRFVDPDKLRGRGRFAFYHKPEADAPSDAWIEYEDEKLLYPNEYSSLCLMFAATT